MASLQLFAVAAAVVAGASAQSSDGDAKIWAAVAFINNGERTPAFGDMRSVLTPIGAQQMYTQGEAFRARYLDQNATTYIQDIETGSIDNFQLDLYSQSDEWVVAGAQAFMQGLYPPAELEFSSSAGGDDLGHDYVSGNATDYPLNGYQYAKIETLNFLDQRSVAYASVDLPTCARLLTQWNRIQGNVRCAGLETELRSNLPQQEDMRKLYENSLDFYENLFSEPPLEGTVSLDNANFWNAYDLYEFVSYMHTHNKTVLDNLKDANDTLNTLESNAAKHEILQNSHETSKATDPINILYTIAGRTLARTVSQQLVSNIAWAGERDKLTVMFGSHEPLIAFFAVAGLLGRRASEPNPFLDLPQPGAAMVFELYGNETQSIDQSLNLDSLTIRFYYKPTVDADETFSNYSLFSSGFDGESLPYTSFIRAMQFYGQSAQDWCEVCGSISAPWCANDTETDDESNAGGFRGRHGSSNHHMSPAVAGVIGAVVMAAIIALVAAALCFLGGFRLKRKPSGAEAAGGFKGQEKRDDDMDVVITKGGARHERVGSWEMRHGGDLGGAVVAKDVGRQSLDEDDASIMGATPVKAHESV